MSKILTTGVSCLKPELLDVDSKNHICAQSVSNFCHCEVLIQAYLKNLEYRGKGFFFVIHFRQELLTSWKGNV